MNTLEGKQEWCKRHSKTTEVVLRCEENETEEDIVRRMLDVDIPGNRSRGRPNQTWEDACKRYVTEVGLKRTTQQKGQN